MNDYDLTKKMLNTMRVVLKEGTNENGAIPLSGEDKKEEEAKLSQVVGPIHFPEENSAILYPHDNNVIIRGQFVEGLSFEMSITDGVYITASSLSLTPTIADMLTKLAGYYEVWKTEWVEKLPDYRKSI
jgi:hypothetical protein